MIGIIRTLLPHINDGVKKIQKKKNEKKEGTGGTIPPSHAPNDSFIHLCPNPATGNDKIIITDMKRYDKVHNLYSFI